MKTKNRKKWLALFCTVLLLPWSMLPSKANATVTSPDKLESWNITDVKLEAVTCNPTTGYSFTGVDTGKTLDGKAFRATVKFAENADKLVNQEYLRLIFGKGNNDTGLVLDAVANGNLEFFYHDGNNNKKSVTTITPDNAGCTLVGEKINLTVTTEYANTTDTHTDVNVGLYFNGKLYGDEYIRVYDVALDTLNQNLTGNVWGDYGTDCETLWVGLPTDTSESEEMTPISSLTPWILSTVGLPETVVNDAANHSFTGTQTAETLDGKAFVTDIKFGNDPNNLTDQEYVRMVLGTGMSDAGLILDAKEGGNLEFFYHDGQNHKKSITTITAAEVGRKLVGEIFELTITTEFVNNNGTTTDVKVGIYFDGVAYKNQYIIVRDVAVDTLVQNVSGNNWGEMNESLWLGIPEEYKTPEQITPPEELDQWSITDVGLSASECNADLHYVMGIETGKTLDKKAFVTMLTYGDSDTRLQGEEYLRIYLGTGETQAFMLDAVEGGSLKFMHYDNGVIKGFTRILPEAAGVDEVIGKQYKLTITTEFVNTSADGTRTDVNVGLYFNDVLYQGAYIKVKDVAVATLNQNFRMDNWGAQNETIKVRDPFQPPEQITPPEELEQWTITDVGLPASECNADLHYVIGTETGKTLDKKAFVTMITYGDSNTRLKSGEYLRICLGTGETQAFMLDAVDGGSLKFIHYDNGVVKGFTRILPEQAGVDEVIGKQYKLTITTEFVNTSADGTRTDVNVGLYFNDVLYQGSYIKVEDVAVATLNQNFRMDNWGAQSEAIKVRDPFLTEYPAITDELTGADFGFRDVVVDNKEMTGTYDDGALKATAITMNLNIPNKKNNSVCFGGKDAGIRLSSRGNGTIAVAYVDSNGDVRNVVTLDAKTAKVASLTDKELEWRFTFQICEKETNKGDLRLGIYINGKLYNASYFEIAGIEIRLPQSHWL